MSEQPETGPQAPDDPGQDSPAPPGQPAGQVPSPELTPEQLAQARAQLQAMGELDPVAQRDEVPDAESLGVHALAEGATPAEVDPRELLASIRALQSQVDRLNAEKKQANVPDVVKYTTAIADHLQARADQHPAVHADPDHTYMPALEDAAAVVNAATSAAESGDISKVIDGLGRLRRFFDRHGRKFPGQDYSYLHDLADEAQSAAEKAAA